MFSDDDVTHVGGEVDPKSDIEVVETELMLADMQTLERAVPRLEKEARTHKDRRPTLEAAQAAQQVLNDGETLFAAGSAGLPLLRELNLLTTKPFLYVFNADEAVLTDEVRVAPTARAGGAGRRGVPGRQDRGGAAGARRRVGRRAARRRSARANVGLTRWRGPVFTRCRLQTFLTAGPKEARAWTIHQGDTAPKAAGVIHSDFEKGFIKAEIVSYNDLVAAGSMAAAKAAGKVRMEGKDYVMADGDVVEFRFQTTTRSAK